MKHENIVATINGEKVVLAEFQHWLSTNRFKVYSFFYQKFGVGDSENFWQSTYEGYSPQVMLKEITLQEITRIKLQMILAKEKGILSTIDYDRLMEERLKVNALRREKVAKNQVIYGPIEYSPKSYFDYLFSNSIIRLKKVLAQQEFYLDDAALKALYEKTKDRYKNSDEKELERYLPLNQVKKDLQNHYVDQKYEELVDQLCQEADIVINKSVYDSEFS